MPTLVLTIATIVVWIALELYYIVNGQQTISSQARSVFKDYPPFGVIVTGLTMALLAHFFWQ